jgi:xylose dehydrogenase (NAD/NADP)
MRWGILSTARIARALLESGSGQEFVAVASRSLERAQAFAAEAGIPRAHGSYEALLADPEVEAVYVPVPNALHVEWSIRALEAGKHVLCEKPMARRPEQVERAFAVAEREGLVLAEAFMWRHHPQLRRARELIAEGAIGRLRLVRAAFSFPLADPDDVRLQADLDGGALMDVGCYCVSGCRALVGAEPERVTAEQVLGGRGGSAPLLEPGLPSASAPARGVDVVLAGTLRFGGGVLGVLDCGLSVAARDELEAAGEEGSLFLDDPWKGEQAIIEVRSAGGHVERIEAGPANPYALELADFEAAARGEADPLLGRDDALGQARTIAALYRSADEGTSVPVAAGVSGTGRGGG